MRYTTTSFFRMTAAPFGQAAPVLTGSLLAGSLLAMSLAMAGCKSNPTQAPITNASTALVPADPNADPAAANLCPAGPLTAAPSSGAPAQPARVLGARTEAPQYTQQGENYAPQQGQTQAYQGPDDPNAQYSGDYQTDVDAGQDAIYANQAPPPLPVYEQPVAPDPNDEWNPGYWNYGSGGYYWVPGAWVAAPYTGALWTPPYWGYYGNRYRFHHGFWGLHVGFYGGVPYGFGYTGYGYEGGYWHGNDFYYNRAVNRINPGFRNVYEHNVTVVNNNYNRVSYNGGPGGIQVRPRPAEVLAYREQHTPPMQTQLAIAREASTNRQQFYAANHGQPALIARPQAVEAVRGIQAPARVNYNQAALAGAQQRNVQEQQRNENLQGRNAAEQQRNVQEQQRVQNLQGRNGAEQQRNVQEQQRNLQEQQRNQNLQGRNAAEQQRNVQEQQRNTQEQQRNAQLQQRTQQNAQQTQQREAQQQQRNVQEQQRNVQEQQRNQQLQQRNQQQAQQSQQREAQQQQRNQQLQQRNVQEQQRQAAPRPEAAPQARPQAAPQPRPQAVPQPRPQAAPQPHPQAAEPHEGGGGHPHR